MQHSVLEAWLRRHGAAFTYHEKIDLVRVLVDEAAKENIRLGVPINQDKVQQYGLELEAGAEFPAIVLWPVKDKQFVVVNGLHRLEAFRLCDRTTSDAYVVDSSDPVLLEVLRRTINVMEGEPLSLEQRIEHALRLVELQYSARDAAQQMAVQIHYLNRALAVAKVRPRLEREGVRLDAVGNLSPTQLQVLSGIGRDKHLATAVTLAHEARLTSDEVRELVHDVRKARDDGAAETVLSEWRMRFADTIARSAKGIVRPPGSPLRRIAGQMHQMERLLSQEPGRGARTLSDKELDALIASVKKMQGQLAAFLVLLQKARRIGRDRRTA